MKKFIVMVLTCVHGASYAASLDTVQSDVTPLVVTEDVAHSASSDSFLDGFLTGVKEVVTGHPGKTVCAVGATIGSVWCAKKAWDWVSFNGKRDKFAEMILDGLNPASQNRSMFCHDARWCGARLISRASHQLPFALFKLDRYPTSKSICDVDARIKEMLENIKNAPDDTIKEQLRDVLVRYRNDNDIIVRLLFAYCNGIKDKAKGLKLLNMYMEKELERMRAARAQLELRGYISSYGARQALKAAFNMPDADVLLEHAWALDEAALGDARGRFVTACQDVHATVIDAYWRLFIAESRTHLLQTMVMTQQFWNWVPDTK